MGNCNPGRVATESRQQYVLDLSRQEVVDYVYECVAKILHSAIEYVKWDMNRQLTDLGSIDLPADRQGKVVSQICSGCVCITGELTKGVSTPFTGGTVPEAEHVLILVCCIFWPADLVLRRYRCHRELEIQEGTSLIYPLSTMGAHVSDCPNHTVGRVTPFETERIVALAGTFGYELDVTRLHRKREMIPGQGCHVP